MGSGEWFATAQDIEERTKGAGEERQNDEAPFQDACFRCRSNIDGDVEDRQSGQNKPEQHDSIEHRGASSAHPIDLEDVAGRKRLGLDTMTK